MESSGNSAAIGCYRCSKRCGGFLTDREQRKVWGVSLVVLLTISLILCVTSSLLSLKGKQQGCEPQYK